MLFTSTAWSQTPTLVQHYYAGANAPPRGLNANQYTFRLPNKTLPGNALVMFLDYPHGAVVTSIEDDAGNTWPTAAAVSADGGTGSPVSAAYVLPNAASGTRVITVHFNSSIAGIHAVFLEYYNVATSAAVGNKVSRANAASPTITAGTLAPAAAASGSLVLHYSMDNVGQVGSQGSTAVTAWSAGGGWAALGGDINNSHDMSSFVLQGRIADGTAFNPTVTATQGRADTFNTLALELKAAAAGTAPSGIRILKQQFYVHTALSVPGTWKEFFPAQGNLLAAINIYHGSTVSPITDSNGNTWTLAHTNSGAPPFLYAQNAATSSSLAVNIPLTSANSNTTIELFDIAGAATSGVMAQAVTVDDTDANGASVSNNAPSITPKNPNGLVIAAAMFGQGPVTGFAAGAPPGAIFMPVTYPNETDYDTFDNADAFGHTYYGSDLSRQNYNWQHVPQGSNSWNAVAVEFKAGTAVSTTVPSGLTASARSSTQIDLTWTAPSQVVTQYLVERCQGSGCSDFTEVATSTSTAYGDTGLTAATTYSYRVRGTVSGGANTGYSNVATVTTANPADTTPPGAPTNLAATAASASQITLSWTAASDNIGVTGYRVERCQGDGCSTFGQVGTPSTTSFSDSSATAGTSYSYRVRAADAAGNLGAYSNIASATTTAAADTARPSTPSGLAATAVNSNQINLQWTASTDDVGVTGYRVLRCQGSNCNGFAQVGTATSTIFGDAGLTAATTYRYRVQAVDAAGNVSPSSNSATATTLAGGDVTAPSAPAGLSATPASASQINLVWSAATDNVGVTSYRVWRCQGSTCSTFAQVATTTSPSHPDSGLLAATTYRYRVQAVDAAGNVSANSSTASATTTAATSEESGGSSGSGVITYVQGNYATPQSPVTSVTVRYTAAQTAGDLNVVVAGWSDTNGTVTSVTDSAGNTYARAIVTTQSGAVSQVVYYAKNIVAAAANTNIVTVRFSASANYADVRVLSYRGLDRTNPLGTAVGATGIGTTSDSGSLTTTSGNQLLFAANTVWSTTAGPGAGFTKRIITSPDGDLVQDQVAANAGTYRATAPLTATGPWIMQVVSFKAAAAP